MVHRASFYSPFGCRILGESDFGFHHNLYSAAEERLGRRPMLDYAGCVLNNWERLDPSGAEVGHG